MYRVGQLLIIEGAKYEIAGKIEFKNLKDNCMWEECRLIQKRDGREYWLSYDNLYKEYSLTRMVRSSNTSGYKLVDSGKGKVTRVEGIVDAEVGDTFEFEEYEDNSEENIISIERWEGEEEVSEGYYLDRDEIKIFEGIESAEKNFNFFNKKFLTIIGIIIFGILIYCFVTGEKTPNIAQYLKKQTLYYEYITSITGENKEKADVYKASFTSVDAVVKDIIDGIEGKTEDVRKNEQDTSTTILTKDEYCFIYEDKIDKNILVQISSRKYAYTSNKSPYHSSSVAHSYYRNYYFMRGFARDREAYSRYNSAYEGYQGTPLKEDNTYNRYSSSARVRREPVVSGGSSGSVRQSSRRSRSFSGGGLSSGK